MASFNLPFGVRVSNDSPLDADRYIADTLVDRDELITGSSVRAYEGLQVYVISEKKLYILKDVDAKTWEEVGGGGESYLASLLDVSIGDDVSAGYVLVYDPSGNDPGMWHTVKPMDALSVFALDSSILWRLEDDLIYPKNIDHDVQLNSIQIETDAGAVTVMDMKVEDADINEEQSYSFSLNEETFLTIYGESDGAGAVENKQVKSSVPLIVDGTETSFMGLGDPSVNGSWRFIIVSGSLSVQKLESGIWVEKGKFV